MDIAQIQHEIEQLPDEQRTALVAWIAEFDHDAWDAQIEQDFSAGGAGLKLLERVKDQVRRGKSSPMGEGARHS